MAYPTFTPPGPVNVSPGSAVSFKPRVNRASFGDGYSQRSGDGINTNPAKFEVSFSVLANAEANTVLAFFEGKKGYLPFMFTLPGEDSPRQWIAPEWRRTYTGKNITDITASLEETFDP